MNETKPTLMLIVNPISGTRSKRKLIPVLERRLKEMGFDIDTRLTGARGDATRLAREAVDKKYYGVLACGGDGTVNETARALCDTGVPLGILPAGSGNGLARHIGLLIDPIEALKVIGERHIEDCDYCTANDRPFFCTFGVGFDAAVTHKFSRQRRRGLLMYLKSAIDVFVSFSPERYSLKTDDRVLVDKAFLIACCNASQYGNNAFIAPAASIRDGLMDITVIHKSNAFAQALVGVDLMTGYIGKNALIDIIRVSHATISRDQAGVAHIDGEPVDMPETIKVACHPGGLRMFTPRDKMKFRPLVTPLKMMLRDWRLAASRLFTPQN